MAKVDTSIAPYFDDYDENKKFYRILYKPGIAVQARELTQMQTMLQKQIDRFGSHIFEQGAQVLPGSREGVKYINNNKFIKLPKTAQGASTEAALRQYWLGKEIISTDQGTNNLGAVGVKAKVVGVRGADSLDEVRLYLQVVEQVGSVEHYVPGQAVTTIDPTGGIDVYTGVIVDSNTAIGYISSLRIERGVYFFDGNFVLVDEQELFLVPDNTEDQAAWSKDPTTRAGLRINESIVTSDDDESLLDNATGSPNFAAPGADRLAIEAVAEQVPLNDESDDFVTLLTVVNGEVRYRVVNTELSVLEDTFARRTFDESGDYTVLPFRAIVRDFLREGINNGVHAEEEYHFFSESEARRVSVEKFGFDEPGSAALHPNVPSVYVPGPSYEAFLEAARSKLSIKIDPGKAYVRGYEIEKISTSIIDLDRARTLEFRDNEIVFTPLGTYMFVEDPIGTPSFESYGTINLYSERVVGIAEPSSDSLIGTAKTLSAELYLGAPGTSGAVYRIYVFDVNILPGKGIDTVKSFWSNSPTFVGNIVLEPQRLIGSVYTDGTPNTIKGRGTSWRNDETQRIVAGDIVQVGLGNSFQQFFVNSNPSNDLVLPVSEAAPSVVDGSVIQIMRGRIYGTDDSTSLVYKLPDDIIYSIRGGSKNEPNFGDIQTSYISRRVTGDNALFVNIINNPNKLINATVNGTNEQFENFSTSDYTVIDTGTGKWMEVRPNLTPGTAPAFTIPEDVAIVDPAGSDLTVYVGPTAVGGGPDGDLYVIASIRRTGGAAAQERAKNLVDNGFDTNGNYFGPVKVTSVDSSDINEIYLNHADVLRVTRIVESPNFNTDPSDKEDLPLGHKDITGAYVLDNGQRDYFYDFGSVKLKPGSVRPKGRVRVEYEYFQHTSGVGNYFSVDSYPFRGSDPKMFYEEIPIFLSSTGDEYDLADCIDFRPVLGSVAGNGNTVFSVIFEPPKEIMQLDYHFYEARRDKLYLDRSGEFRIKSGEPAAYPLQPQEPATGMTIYNLILRPYTASPEDCVLEFVDNRRYTMKDIGKLEARIKNLEFYTSLTLLEKDTTDLAIPDALGNDKFKNGFLVDNFTSFASSDTRSADYKCTIHEERRELRPLIQRRNLGLFEKNLLITNTVQREDARAAAHYQKTGDVYTLPYEEVVMLEQLNATKVSNINPFQVFTFVGSVKLTPSSDEWKDDTFLPPLEILDSGQYDAVNNHFSQTGGTQVSWGASINNWTGISTTKTDTGKEILLQLGRSDLLQEIRGNKQGSEEEQKENKQKGKGNKGSKGNSTQSGPGKTRPARENSDGSRNKSGGDTGRRGRRKSKRSRKKRN